MTTIFILGREPAISISELLSVFKREHNNFEIEAVDSEFILARHVDTDLFELMTKLGGIVKIAGVLGEVSSLESAADFCTRELNRAGQKKFGISLYGNIPDKLRAGHRLGMIVKRALKDDGHVRLVTALVQPLSSATVLKEKLIDQGAEFVIVPHQKKLFVGITAAIQPLEEFAAADMNRPRRNLLAGMIPPKLARMMVNLAAVPLAASAAQNEPAILDPFCGGGTIIAEALRLGYKNVVCSDVSAAAVSAARENLSAISDRPKFLVSDVRALLTKLSPASIDAIITEPTLGPPLHGNESPEKIRRTATELEDLYASAIAVFTKILKPGGRAVFVSPVFSVKQSRDLKSRGQKIKNQNAAYWQFLRTAEIFQKFGFTLTPLLPPELLKKFKHTTEYGTLLYARPDQHIGREIIVARGQF
ncbi:MAG: hypothetical protein HW383_837 [Candidatus Magasanikbacteria bacterium]|nr:hypothetical protein [Candidatus Magasanikbacteria bacterium]